MKKFFIMFLLITIMSIGLIGCTPSTQTEQEILKEEIEALEEYKTILENEIESLKKDNGLNTYIVKFEATQKNFIISDANFFKDSLNKLEFEIPVSKEFYEFVEKEDILDDSFKMGSYSLNGSFDIWELKVIDKYLK